MVVFLALKILQKKKLLNKVIFWDYMSKTRIEVLIYTTSRKAISLPTHTWFVWFITKLNQVKEKGQNTSIYSKMLVLTNYLRWLNSTKWRPSYFLFITFDNSQFSSLPFFFWQGYKWKWTKQTQSGQFQHSCFKSATLLPTYWASNNRALIPGLTCNATSLLLILK